jgi:hypothetical protein
VRKGRRLGDPHGLGNCGMTLVATSFSISVASSLTSIFVSAGTSEWAAETSLKFLRRIGAFHR